MKQIDSMPAARLLLMAAFTAFSAACAAPSAERSLHARLGGTAGVAAIVSDTIDRTAVDPRTKRAFADVKLAALKDSIAQQICALAGGGCTYEGETMAKAHKDLAITHAEFDLMVQNLRDALDARVGEREKNELLRLLAPMKRDVVGR